MYLDVFQLLQVAQDDSFAQFGRKLGQCGLDLRTQLVEQQLLFAWYVVVIECRVLLYRFGLATVSPVALLEVFDGLRLELRSLVPVELPSLA